MPVELHLGLPASGKTEYCIQKIRAIKTKQPLSKIWVLVPDYQNGSYFRYRLVKYGGTIGVTISTFSALHKYILESNQINKPVISSALEHRLVQETVDSIYQSGSLSHYAAIRNKPGFIQALQDIFSELRSAFVSPIQFSKYTQNTSPAKSELALLYETFLSHLEELNWIDRDGQIWQAIQVMEDDPNSIADIPLVVVDGFSAFATARIQFLKLLSQHVDELLITLPGQLDSDRPVHHKAISQIEKLENELSPKITQTKSPPYLFPENRHLEKYVLDPGDYPKHKPSSPIFLEAPSQYEEVREALRWIKTLIIRNRISIQSCALFVPNLQVYRPLLQVASKEFGIEIHFSQSESLLESPAIQSILNLLQLPLDNFQSRSLFAVLRSPFFNFGLQDQDLENLEAIILHTRIVASREQWDEAWDLIKEMNTQKKSINREERDFKDALADIDISSLQTRFSHFWELFTDIDIEKPQKNWVLWLESLLENISFYDQIKSERDKEASTSYTEALKALIQSEEVAGHRKTDYPTFISDLQAVLRSARLDDPETSRWNALQVGKLSEARATRYKAVTLLGFSEGSFPGVENPDPFLDEKLRKELGLEPRLEREQASIFYQAFTRADSHLLITRASLSEDGEKWEPSPYWESASRCFGKDAIKIVRQNSTLDQADAASSQEVLFLAVQQNHLLFHNYDDLALRWNNLEHSRKVLHARRSKEAQGPYEGSTIQITKDIAEIFPSHRPWSASRLETSGTCPYQFYVQNILGLVAKETPELGMNVQQVGSMLHRILELVYEKALPDADFDQLLTILDQVCEQVFQYAPRAYGFRPSSLWVVEQSQFKKMLKETIRALERESIGWTPKAFEQKFGIGNSPPLAIELDAESILLRGLIDRVDKHISGSVRVIDYKTGGSHLSVRDFLEGRRLQLPIYALAAQDALEMGKVVEAFYWSIRSAKSSSLKLSEFSFGEEIGLEAAKIVLIEHIQNSLQRIRSGRFPPEPPRGGCPNYCPAATWCWRYQPGW